MSAELFNAEETPFNLAGESLNAEFDAQAEAEEKRARDQAEADARNRQLVLDNAWIGEPCFPKPSR